MATHERIARRGRQARRWTIRQTGESIPHPAAVVNLRPSSWARAIRERYSARKAWLAPLELVPGGPRVVTLAPVIRQTSRTFAPRLAVHVHLPGAMPASPPAVIVAGPLGPSKSAPAPPAPFRSLHALHPVVTALAASAAERPAAGSSATGPVVAAPAAMPAVPLRVAMRGPVPAAPGAMRLPVDAAPLPMPVVASPHAPTPTRSSVDEPEGWGSPLEPAQLGWPSPSTPDSTLDMSQLTEQVVQALDRRSTAQRERMGRW